MQNFDRKGPFCEKKMSGMNEAENPGMKSNLHRPQRETAVQWQQQRQHWQHLADLADLAELAAAASSRSLFNSFCEKILQGKKIGETIKIKITFNGSTNRLSFVVTK